MAFKDALSKVGKTIGEGAASAKEKSQELIEITKLKGVIHNEEEKIKKNYLELGKLVYQKHKDVGDTSEDTDKKIGELLAEIDLSNAVIAKTNEELEALKSKKQ